MQFEESSRDASEACPRQQRHPMTPERIAVLHDMISRRLGVKVLAPQAALVLQSTDQFSSITALSPFLRRRGTIMQLISAQMNSSPIMSENTRDERYRTFSFSSEERVTHLVL